VLNSPDTFEEMLLESMFASPLNHVGSLMAREAVLAADGYDEEMMISADFSLWSRMLARGCRFATTKDVLIAIRFHSESASATRVDKEMRETSRLMRQNIFRLTGMQPSSDDAALLWQMVYQVSALSPSSFDRGIILLREVFNSVKKDFALMPADVERYRARQLKIIFVKRIFGCIKDNNAQEVVRLCGLYQELEGRKVLFAVIGALARMGNRAVSWLPLAYDCLAALRCPVRTKHS